MRPLVNDDIFFLRLKLLVIMGSYRRQALVDTIEGLCDLLAEPLHLTDIPILKVA
ncbi:MAG: hypothetical protein WAU91_04945 [Desulfatitalea sp.]